jgi:uncharacterized damage-inducible protein DinB
MSHAKNLAKHIEHTVTGPMWHGPALAQVLQAVTHDRAALHPIPGAHSIWEIVAHVAVWAEIARARLKGESTGDPTPEQDWPAVASASLDDWRIAVERLGFSHRVLAADVREMDDQHLDATVPGLDYSVSVLLHGVVEHGTYHGGQIALLTRAAQSMSVVR